MSLIPSGGDMNYNTKLVTVSGGIYLMENGTKRAFPNEITFFSYSYKWADVITISSAELAAIPAGTDMVYNTHYRDGKVTSTGGGIYFIENGYKRAFPNEQTFFNYSYKLTDVVKISSTEMELIPTGKDMGYEGKPVSVSGGIYLIKDGKKRAFPNEITFFSYSYKWADVITISSAELAAIPAGTDMVYNTHYRDGLLISASGGGIYLIDNGTKRAFPSQEIFLSYSYKWSDVINITDIELLYIPDGLIMTAK